MLDNIEDGPDGGVDLRLRKNGQVVFVQCKHWKARSVGVKVVRELYGVMAAKNVKHGTVVTYGAFTSEASDFAKANSIALIDGPKLTQMIASVQQSGNMQAQPEVARACPKCGSEMVLRVAKKHLQPGKLVILAVGQKSDILLGAQVYCTILGLIMVVGAVVLFVVVALVLGSGVGSAQSNNCGIVGTWMHSGGPADMYTWTLVVAPGAKVDKLAGGFEFEMVAVEVAGSDPDAGGAANIGGDFRDAEAAFGAG